MHSVLRSTDALNHVLRRFTPPTAGSGISPALAQPPIHPDHPLANRDLDTGRPVKPAGYSLTDQTYARLVHRLATRPSSPIPPGVRADILTYYADLDLPFATKNNAESWATLQAELVTFRSIPISTAPAPYPTYGEATDAEEPSHPAPIP